MPDLHTEQDGQTTVVRKAEFTSYDVTVGDHEITAFYHILELKPFISDGIEQTKPVIPCLKKRQPRSAAQEKAASDQARRRQSVLRTRQEVKIVKALSPWFRRGSL